MEVPHRVGHPVKVKQEINDDTYDEPPEKKYADSADFLKKEETMENHEIASFPSEIQMNIVKNEETRTSPLQCSKSCKDLIGHAKLNLLRETVIFYALDTWICVIEKEEFRTGSFAAAQERISEIFRNIDYVESFVVDIDMRFEKKFLKFPRGFLNVEHLQFNTQLAHYPLSYKTEMNMLKQFNPYYLSHVESMFEKRENGRCQSVYDLPQIYLPEKVELKEYCSIRDDQLLKLNATELIIEGAECLTKPGIAQYLRKCLTELNTKHFSIDITFEGPRAQNLLRGFSPQEMETLRIPFAEFQRTKEIGVPVSTNMRTTILYPPYPGYRLLVDETWNRYNITVIAQRI